MSSPSPRARFLPGLWPLAAAGGLVACASTTSIGGVPPDEAPGHEQAQAEEKAEHAERELLLAQLDLAVAELEAKQSMVEAERALEDAGRELEEADKALALFRDHERPSELAEAQLDLDRSRHRNSLAKDELNELISMYEAEEFAELTKELVLKRGRKSAEFAQRSLALAEAEFALLQSEELPRRERELEQGLREAQQSLADAKRALEVTRIETKIALMKAHNELADAQESAADDTERGD